MTVEHFWMFFDAGVKFVGVTLMAITWAMTFRIVADFLDPNGANIVAEARRRQDARRALSMEGEQDNGG